MPQIRTIALVTLARRGDCGASWNPLQRSMNLPTRYHKMPTAIRYRMPPTPSPNVHGDEDPLVRHRWKRGGVDPAPQQPRKSYEPVDTQKTSCREAIRVAKVHPIDPVRPQRQDRGDRHLGNRQQSRKPNFALHGEMIAQFNRASSPGGSLCVQRLEGGVCEGLRGGVEQGDEPGSRYDLTRTLSAEKGGRGQNAAAPSEDRRASAGGRGYLTHAGLAAMAEAARLGPA